MPALTRCAAVGLQAEDVSVSQFIQDFLGECGGWLWQEGFKRCMHAVGPALLCNAPLQVHRLPRCALMRSSCPHCAPQATTGASVGTAFSSSAASSVRRVGTSAASQGAGLPGEIGRGGPREQGAGGRHSWRSRAAVPLRCLLPCAGFFLATSSLALKRLNWQTR